MYKKFETSWIKHLDFLIIDTFSLQTAFTLAYLLAFQMFNGDNSYFGDYYLQISVMLLVVNGCAAFLDEGYHNILRRGYIQEAKANAKHILLVMAMMLVYFYITRQIVRINPVFFLMMTLFSLVLTYCLRIGYKALFMRRQSKNPEQRYQMMVLTSSDKLKDVLEGMDGPVCQVCAICLADAEEGSMTQHQGIPVVCDMKNLLDYIKDHVVDGLFIDLPDTIPLPDLILSTCATMGVSTHLGLARKDYAHQGEVIERIGQYYCIDQKREGCQRSTALYQTGNRHLCRSCRGDCDWNLFPVCCSDDLYCKSGTHFLFSNQGWKEWKTL